MARDFLAIPATSTSVKRVFSRSRHICSDLRSSLKAGNNSETLLAKLWIRNGLLNVPGVCRPRKRQRQVLNYIATLIFV
jgi:hAT family C-terminal dimerisation region